MLEAILQIQGNDPQRNAIYVQAGGPGPHVAGDPVPWRGVGAGESIREAEQPQSDLGLGPAAGHRLQQDTASPVTW